MSYTIRDGALTEKDPSDIRIFQFDWDRALTDGALIVGSTYEAIGVRGDVLTTPLIVDGAAILAGERQTQVRLQAGAKGSIWRINNRIVTSEVPSQTIERSFYLLIQDQ